MNEPCVRCQIRPRLDGWPYCDSCEKIVHAPPTLGPTIDLTPRRVDGIPYGQDEAQAEREKPAAIRPRT